MSNDEYDNLQKALILAEADLILARKKKQALTLDALKQAQITGAYLPPSIFKSKRMLESLIGLLNAILSNVDDA